MLVRVHYSLVSVGTEIAAIAPPVDADADALEKGRAYAQLAWTYLGKAVNDPDKAARRLAAIARRHMAALAPGPSAAAPAAEPRKVALDWERAAATALDAKNGSLRFTADTSPGLYQVLAAPVAVPAGHSVAVELKGSIEGGPISLGLLGPGRQIWVGTVQLGEGPIEDSVVFDVNGATEISAVFANANTGQPVKVSLDGIKLTINPPPADGLPPTELHQQGWNLGYSVAGEVVAVGEGVTDLAPGDRVACGGAGAANHADFVSVKRNLVVRVPDGCSLRAAASVTVGAIALQGVRRAEPRLGDIVCVAGLGLIGLLSVQMLRAAGCTVIGYEIAADRIERAKKLGLVHAAARPGALKALVRDLTGGHGVDATLITAATKSDEPINLAMEATRAKGTVVIVGDIGMKVERPAFYRKEIDLRMSTSYGPGRYDRSYEEDGHDYPYGYVRWTLNRNMQAYLGLIAEGRVDMDALTDLVVPIDQAPEAYRLLAQPGAAKPIGVLLHYPEPQAAPAVQFDRTAITVRGHARAPASGVRYALVGAGGFGMGMLVPVMARQKGMFHLRGVVSRDGVRGGNFARSQRVELLATELDALVDDPGFDLFVIATRHDQHADQVAKCLSAGKHVFVEKPLAITWDQLDRVAKLYEGLAEKPLLMVGFNRRFAPAIARLAEVLDGRRSPLTIAYRLNGGYIPPDHWVQGPEGGGRNIGEACHMYDLFRRLAGAPVATITARAIDPGTLPYLATDNFCATLGYEDGSLANLVYTALGPKAGLAKERIEVFCDGEAYVVDDFRRLIRASDNAVLWQSDEVDKGHAAELAATGRALIEGGPAPIAFAEIVETTAVALHIEDLLRQGGG